MQSTMNSYENYEDFVSKLFKRFPEYYHMEGHTANMVHAALGIAGESGEIVDMVKKFYASNKPLDIGELDKEIGDLMFYVQAMIIITGGNLEEILAMNQAKLLKRYGGTEYSDEAARNQIDKDG